MTVFFRKEYFNTLDGEINIDLAKSFKRYNPDEIYKNIKLHPENETRVPEDLWDDFTTFSKKYCADLNDDFYIDKWTG